MEVEGLGDGRYAVSLNGARHEVEALVLPHGAVSLMVEGHSWSVEFDERKDEVGVLLRGHVTRFDIADERKLRLRQAAATFTTEGKQIVEAPMPGKITRVLVKPGDAVIEGQGLVVVEAMKMENELKSPKAGTVTAVHAKEGGTVENGTPLVVVE